MSKKLLTMSLVLVCAFALSLPANATNLVSGSVTPTSHCTCGQNCTCGSGCTCADCSHCGGSNCSGCHN